MFGHKFYDNENKNYAKFISRDDPTGIFLGNYTNCCQHPMGTGRYYAWHGQESENSGFLGFYNQINELIAMSWIWTAQNTLVVDNIESKGLGNREFSIIEILQNIKKSPFFFFDDLNVGERGDVNLESLPIVKTIELPPEIKLEIEDW